MKLTLVKLQGNENFHFNAWLEERGLKLHDIVIVIVKKKEKHETINS